MPAAQAKVVRLADVFRNEIRAIRNLGCILEIKTETSAIGPAIVYARITPVTQKATQGLRLAAEEDGAPGRKAIEVRQPFGRPADMLDAASTAIGLALDIARTALA